VTIPAWILDAFAALMLAVAVLSAARLVVARPWPRADADADVDVSHLLMGIAMAGTLAAGLRTLPDAAWEVVFGLLTVWFAGRVGREIRGHGTRVLADGHHLPHLVHSVAMLYMFLALTGPRAAAGTGMTSMAASAGTAMHTLRLPTLALLFAFVLIGFVVSDLDRLSRPAALSRYRPARAGFAPAGVALAGAGAMATSAGRPSPAESAPAESAHAESAPAESVPAATAPPQPSLSAAPPSGPTATAGRLLTPGVVRGCRIAMGVTMAFMLIIMI
jgi:Domain of unknown function (DUF5134)